MAVHLSLLAAGRDSDLAAMQQHEAEEAEVDLAVMQRLEVEEAEAEFLIGTRQHRIRATRLGSQQASTAAAHSLQKCSVTGTWSVREDEEERP